MMEEKDIYTLLINWYDGAILISDRITSGNLSHQKSLLKGYALRISEYIKKHYSDNEIAISHASTFNYISDKCDRLTTGNLSHDNNIIRAIAKNNISLINKKLNKNI